MIRSLSTDPMQRNIKLFARGLSIHLYFTCLCAKYNLEKWTLFHIENSPI